jgi:hypothetical protein
MLGWVVLGGAAAAHAINWATTFHRKAGRLPKLIEEAKSLGLPTTAEEYEAIVAVPDGENAAPVYEELVRFIQTLETSQPNLVKSIRNQRLKSGPDPFVVREHRAEFESVNGMFRRASAFQLFRHNRFSDAKSRAENHLVVGLKTGFRMYGLAIEQLAIEHRFDEALDELAIMQKCFGQGIHEPMLLAWLVDISCRSFYFETTNFIVKRGFEIPGVLDRADSALRCLPPILPLRQALRGEFFLNVFSGNVLQREGLAPWYPDGPPYPMSLAPFRTKKALAAWTAESASNELRTIQSLPPSNDNPIETVNYFAPPWYAGHWWLVPTEGFRLSKVNWGSALIHHRARQVLSQAGIDLHRVRLSLGTFPSTLPAPTQPDRYHPLRYERLENGFTLRTGNFEY